MTPDEREVRRALEARSGEVSPEFRARMSGALQAGRPAVRAMPALAAAMAIIIALGSVGVLLMARGAHRASYGGPVTGTLYTVTTDLGSDPSGRVVACHAWLLSLPPPLCGGVPVTNVDFAAISGKHTYSNGVAETPTLTLVGTWDGHALRLTEPPHATKLKGTDPQPVPQAPPPASGKPAAQVFEELRRDNEGLKQRGIILLQWGQGADGVEVVLAVPDPKAVQYLYDTYGRMHIKGWLQPVNSPLPTPTIVQKTPVFVPLFNQLSAPSGNVVWAWVADGRLYRSTDRGNTWEERSQPPVPRVGNADFSFLNAQEGWFLIGGADEPQCFEGRAQIWHTTDGAATWRKVPIDGWYLSYTSDNVGGETCKHGITFTDPLHGYISAWGANRHPIIYRTLDGGLNWAGATLTDPPGFLTQTGTYLRPGPVRAFGSTLLVYAWSEQPGEWMPTSVYVFRATDRGSTWSYLAKSLDIAFHTVTFLTTSRWLQIGNQASDQETTDAGKTWHPFTSDYVAAAGVPGVIAFGDELVGYSTNRGGIYRTVDGGAHWVKVKTPGT